MAIDTLLDERQAAAVLHCSPRTIRTLVATGQLRSLRVGRLRRYTPADLREYVERQRAADAESRSELEPVA